MTPIVIWTTDLFLFYLNYSHKISANSLSGLLQGSIHIDETIWFRYVYCSPKQLSKKKWLQILTWLTHYSKFHSIICDTDNFIFYSKDCYPIFFTLSKKFTLARLTIFCKFNVHSFFKCSFPVCMRVRLWYTCNLSQSTSLVRGPNIRKGAVILKSHHPVLRNALDLFSCSPYIW